MTDNGKGANPRLPFGSVGHSGIGRIGGYEGFKIMSNERSVVHQPLDKFRDFLIQLPPYSDRYAGLIMKGIKMAIFSGIEVENVISVMDMLPTLTTAAGIPAGNEREIDGVDRWNAVLGNGPKDRGQPMFFTSNLSLYNYFQYGVLDGPWKLYQKVDHQRRMTEVETMLFNVWEDPNEENDISAKHPEHVQRSQGLLDDRLAEHPVGGTYVQIQLHPGWRAPLDYAASVDKAETVNQEQYPGFVPLKSKVLQKTYGDRGKIIYD